MQKLAHFFHAHTNRKTKEAHTCWLETLQIFRLSCDLFYLLVSHFRSFLKNDIGVFFQTMILRCIEPSTFTEVPLENRLIALDCTLKIFKDAYILVDVFFNFDCDMNLPNIYERLLSALEKCSQRTDDEENMDVKNRVCFLLKVHSELR